MYWRQTAAGIYSDKYGRWLVHLLFWLFIIAARCYIQEITFNAYKGYTWGVILSSVLSTANIALIYYLIVGWSFPIWKKKKYVQGIASLLLLVVLYTWLDYLTELYLLRDLRWKAIMQQYQPDYFAFLQRGIINILLAKILSLGIIYQLFLGLALPLVVRMSLEYSRLQLRRLELARQNLQLEFNFLRSQVNPHFLFNTLNNIYSLILHDKKEQSAEMVARLSAFMRYSLQETDAERTPMEKEVQLMKDYIGLEKVRLNYTVVEMDVETQWTGYYLPPLLLLPLLENAFKYCPDGRQSVISISLRQEAGRLHFICRNTYDPGRPSEGPGGIGVNNVIRRLEQYYPDRYIFTVSENDTIYTVDLIIDKL